MASSSICSGCTHYQCEGCSLPKSQRLNAAHETVPEASKPKRRRPSRPSAERHYVPWFPGRKNGFAQMCAGCKTEVAKGAGHLAKLSSDDRTWHVLCNECRTTGALITVPGPEEPEEATVRGKMSDGMVTFLDIKKAGEAHFDKVYSSQEWKLGSAYARQPDAAFGSDVFDIMEKVSSDIERGLDAEFALILNAPSKPGATLQEAYHWPARDVLSEKAARLEWSNIFNKPEKPEKPKAHPWRTYHAASASGFKWADSVNHTSERDTMLGAGFGELPPSKLRKHRAKRPKRVGW